MSVAPLAHAAMKLSDLFYLFEDRGPLERDGVPYRREVRRPRFASKAGGAAARAPLALALLVAAAATVRWFYATPVTPLAPVPSAAPEKPWDAPEAP